MTKGNEHNSPEHMARMRARITPRTHSAEYKLERLTARIAKERQKLNEMEQRADALRLVIAKRSKAKEQKNQQPVDANVEAALQLLMEMLTKASGKSIG